MVSRSDKSRKPIGHKRQPFIQPMTAVIRNHGQLTTAELAVLLDVLSYDWHGQGTWVAQKTVADDLGIGERTVRDALKKLERVGAIERQPRPGQSNLNRINLGWVPTDPGNIRRGTRSSTTRPTPAETAAPPGNSCRSPQNNLPHTPAAPAAEVDSTNYTQQVEAKTDNVPPPTASEEQSGTTLGANQERTQEEASVLVAVTTEPPAVASTDSNAVSDHTGMAVLAQSLGNVNYSSPRPDPAEEAKVVDLAKRFNTIQALIGKEQATGARWQKSLTGFRMMLFSQKHGHSYDSVCLVLDYLRNNPGRAKEIVNKDKKRGVTNTYYLMFLFERLLSEAEGHESTAENMFSKRRVLIT